MPVLADLVQALFGADDAAVGSITGSWDYNDGWTGSSSSTSSSYYGAASFFSSGGLLGASDPATLGPTPSSNLGNYYNLSSSSMPSPVYVAPPPPPLSVGINTSFFNNNVDNNPVHFPHADNPHYKVGDNVQFHNYYKEKMFEKSRPLIFEDVDGVLNKTFEFFFHL